MKIFFNPQVFAQNLSASLNIAGPEVVRGSMETLVEQDKSAELLNHSNYSTIPLHLLAERKETGISAGLSVAGGEGWARRFWRWWQIDPPSSNSLNLPPSQTASVSPEVGSLERIPKDMILQLLNVPRGERRKFAEEKWSNLPEEITVSFLSYLLARLDGRVYQDEDGVYHRYQSEYIHRGWEVFDFLFPRISEKGRRIIIERVLSKVFFGSGVKKFALGVLVMIRKHLSLGERQTLDEKIIHLQKELSIYVEKVLEVETDPSLRAGLE